MKRQKSIFLILFHTFICFALFPILISGVGSYFIASKVVTDKVRNTLQNTSKQVELSLENYLKGLKSVSDYYCYNNSLKQLLENPFSYENLLRIEEEIKKNDVLFLNLGNPEIYLSIFGSGGQIYTNWETDGQIYSKELRKEIEKQDWYEQMYEIYDQVIWIPHMDNIQSFSSNEKVFSLVRKFIDNKSFEKKEFGFLILSISIDDLEKNLKNLEGNSFLIDDLGFIITHANKELVGDVIDMDTFKNQLNKKEMGYMYLDLKKGKGQAASEKNLIAYQYNDTSGFYTITAIPVKEMNQQIKMIILWVLTVMIFSIMVLFVIAYYLSKSICKPIQQLESAMGTIKNGRLNEVDMDSGVKEIVSLSRSFNRMIGKIDELIKQRIKDEEKTKELEIKKTQAELQFLRAQINPHFLFNTLNSIKWLSVIHHAQPVADMLSSLGRLLECSMQKGNDFITVKEEVQNTSCYINLQEMRYGNKLHFFYEIEEEVESCMVPKLILQPIVENAIIHGIGKMEDCMGNIEIKAYKMDENICFKVIDDGIGMKKEKMEEFFEHIDYEENNKGLNGIGIRNIHQRLQLIYGEQYGVNIESRTDKSGIVVKIIMPKKYIME